MDAQDLAARSYTIYLGKLTGPRGNPYAIMASLARQIREQGCSHPETEEVLQQFARMTYPQILEFIDEFFVWIDRDQSGLDPDKGWMPLDGDS